MANQTGRKNTHSQARKRYQISQREQQCFDLWVGGATYREMSAILIAEAKRNGIENPKGMSYEQCRRNVQKVLKAENQDFEADVGDFKVKAFNRLEKMYMRASKASAGYMDKDGYRRYDAKAAKIALDCLKEQIDLTGHRRPVKVENPDGTALGQNIAEAFDKALMKAYGSEDPKQDNESSDEADNDS